MADEITITRMSQSYKQAMAKVKPILARVLAVKPTPEPKQRYYLPPPTAFPVWEWRSK